MPTVQDYWARFMDGTPLPKDTPTPGQPSPWFGINQDHVDQVIADSKKRKGYRDPGSPSGSGK